jgi:hypothetical protein
MHGSRKNLWHIRNENALQCDAKLWYNQIVVNDVVKLKMQKLKT